MKMKFKFIKNEYNTLLKNLESNKKWLLKLLEEEGIYVSPYLRIAINPLFIKVLELLKNDENKRKKILSLS